MAVTDDGADTIICAMVCAEKDGLWAVLAWLSILAHRNGHTGHHEGAVRWCYMHSQEEYNICNKLSLSPATVAETSYG